MTDLLPTPSSIDPRPAADPIGRVERTRFSLLDRPWAGHWTGVIVTPVRVPSLATLRDVWRRLSAAHPGAALVGRMDERSWITVPAADRAAFADSTIVPIDDPAADDADAFLARSLPLLAADRPVLVGVGERTLLLLISHRIGDAATVTLLIKALLEADADALGELTAKADLPDVVRAARTQTREHGRQWLSMARRKIGGSPRGPRPTTPPAPSGAAMARAGGDPAVVSVRWSTADLQLISRWRARHAKGMSITTVLSAATHRALTEAGLPMATDGFHTLVDLRRYLPESDRGFLPGNLAKSVLIDADPADLRAVGEATREMVDSARPVLATVLGAVAGAISRRSAPAHDAHDGPVAMTFNSMPSLPGLSALPWLPGEARQYIGVGYPTVPGSLTIFAMRMREHMQVTTVFPSSMIDPEVMRRTLLEIPHRVGDLVTSPNETS